MKKSVSIIIPAFNEERHLPACLGAIAAQTDKPDEVLVIDNNSTDATAEIAKRYKFVRVIGASQQGIVFARNVGFDAAKSDIIARIDADTVLPTHWVADVRNFFASAERFENNAYTGGGSSYNIRLPRINAWFQSQLAFRVNRLLLGHYILFGSNMAFPYHLWDKVRDDVCIRNDVHEDLDLSIHLHRLGYKITYDAGNVVGIKLRRVRTNRKQFLAHYLLWPNTLRAHGNWRWPIAWLGAYFYHYGSCVPVIMEWVARLFGKPPLPEA